MAAHILLIKIPIQGLPQQQIQNWGLPINPNPNPLETVCLNKSGSFFAVFCFTYFFSGIKSGNQ